MKNSVVILFLSWMVSFLALAGPSDTLEVKVLGTNSDARFEPGVIMVSPGDVIRFEVMEGLHTVTAYHPENRRPLRLPEAAASFDSGLLSAGEQWFLKIEQEGVYDYFCLPHERMGHVGRIISGDKITTPDYDDSLIPEKVLQQLNKAQNQLRYKQRGKNHDPH